MYNELVHVLGFFPETCQAIAADLGGPEVEFEERVVASADYGEVVRHSDTLPNFVTVLIECGLRRLHSRHSLVDVEGVNIHLVVWAVAIPGLGISAANVPKGKHRTSTFSRSHHSTSLRSHTTMFGAFKPSAPLSGGLLWCVSCQSPKRASETNTK